MNNKITTQEIESLLCLAETDLRFGVAFRGALSQIRIKKYLNSKGFKVFENQSDNAGKPDFVVNGMTLEHKRAKAEKSKEGSIQAEFQKSRGRNPERLYELNFADIVSVDVSAHTGNKNDYRFNFTTNLKTHQKYPNKIKSIQTIDNNWKSNLRLLVENKFRE
tara:strand:- start:442 stop:930 length:489 start_codon:yes stop_codon:yes gene_type:complete